jgi:hypothetical protein
VDDLDRIEQTQHPIPAGEMSGASHRSPVGQGDCRIRRVET